MSLSDVWVQTSMDTGITLLHQLLYECCFFFTSMAGMLATVLTITRTGLPGWTDGLGWDVLLQSHYNPIYLRKLLYVYSTLYTSTISPHPLATFLALMYTTWWMLWNSNRHHGIKQKSRDYSLTVHKSIIVVTPSLVFYCNMRYLCKLLYTLCMKMRQWKWLPKHLMVNVD